MTLNIIYHCSLHMTINSFFISICLYLYHILETDAGCFYHLDDAFSFYLTFLLADSADSGWRVASPDYLCFDTICSKSSLIQICRIYVCHRNINIHIFLFFFTYLSSSTIFSWMLYFFIFFLMIVTVDILIALFLCRHNNNFIQISKPDNDIMSFLRI